ncbi:DDE 3 domain-containing protein, partial [Aphis craccivora]
MDNASYHSTLIDNFPKSHTRKADVQAWLTKKNVNFSPLENIAELRMRVKALIPFEKKYELDVLALEMGHEVIRLPPYHCQYNPIELIWAQVKNQVAKNNKTFKMVDLEKLTHEALDSVTQHDWEKCVRHAEALQDQDNENEIMRDSMLEPIILTLLPEVRLEKANGNPKMCWKLINNFIDRGNKQNRTINTIMHNGTELNVKDNENIISNKFNDYFINAASDLLTKLKNQQNLIQKLLTVSDSNTSNKIILSLFIPTNELEIINQISKLKNGSSPGLDEQLGLRDRALQLLHSYLSDRKQCVKINESISSLNIVKCGVPQGTVISPILLNIQLNGIHSLSLKSQIICYADDTVMLCSGACANSGRSRLKCAYSGPLIYHPVIPAVPVGPCWSVHVHPLYPRFCVIHRSMCVNQIPMGHRR